MSERIEPIIKTQVSRQIHRYWAVLLSTFYSLLSTTFKFLLRLTTYDLRLTLLTSYFLLHTSYLNAQLLTPLSHEMNRRVEWEMSRTNTPFFTVLKPYVDTQLRGNARQDSLNVIEPRTKNQEPRQNTWLHRKLLDESFIQVDSGDFYLFADPVFELGIGKEVNGNNTYINTRGFRVGGRIGNYFGFGADIYESQAIFNSSISEQIKKTKVVPGQTRARPYGNSGSDFSLSTGYISFSFFNKLYIQLAQGKQFIGDGYRSLLLSDASSPYPYMNFHWEQKSFFYSWNLNLLQDLDVNAVNSTMPVRRKMLTIHTLGFRITDKIQIAIVKMQLYNNPDSFGRFNFKALELNPLPFPTEFKEANHSVFGFNAKVSPFSFLNIYNQWSVDNFFEGDKHYAFQLGCKFYGKLYRSNLYIQGEYNRVPAYTYASGNRIFNWKHMNESLTHPYGNNFEEVTIIVNWHLKRWQLRTQVNTANFLDKINDPNYLNRLKFPYYSNNQKLNLYNVEVSYIFNRKSLMSLSVGIIYRQQLLTAGSETLKYIYISLGTQLFNKYYDF